MNAFLVGVLVLSGLVAVQTWVVFAATRNPRLLMLNSAVIVTTSIVAGMLVLTWQ